MTNNGNACKTCLTKRRLGKLPGTCDDCHTTINMKPVNFVKRWCLAEDRGLVVPYARHYGKEAKSAHDSLGQGVACSDQSLNETVSSNDEQVLPDSTMTILNKLNQMGGVNSHPINGRHKQMRRCDLWITAYAKLSRNPGSYEVRIVIP